LKDYCYLIDAGKPRRIPLPEKVEEEEKEPSVD
jgi:hypothetical protein